MKRIFPTLSRLLILFVILGGAFYFFSSQTTSLSLGSNLGPVSKIMNFDTSKISGLAKEKFVDQQPIISEPEKNKVVLGEQTTAVVSDQAKQMFNKTTEIVGNELKNLPKKEAAKILRQTCEQVAQDLEK